MNVYRMNVVFVLLIIYEKKTVTTKRTLKFPFKLKLY